MGLSDAGRRPDLLFGGVRSPVGDVGADGFREEEALLEDHADLAAQRVQRDVAQVETVDAHRSLIGIVEAGHHHGDGRLPAPARTDQGDPLPGGDAEVEPLQECGAVAVAEGDVGEGDLALERGQFERVGGVGDGGGQVEELEDALDARSSLLPDGKDAGQLTRRGDQLHDVGGEGQEGAQRDLVVQGQPTPEGQDGHLPDGRDRLEHRLVARLEPHRPHLRAVQDLRSLGDPLELVLLLAERLDDAHAVDILVDDLRHVPFALLPVPGGGEDLAPHAVGHDQQAGGDDHAHHRQEGGQIDHDAEGEGHQQDVPAHDGEEAEQSLHQGRVGVGPGDQLPGGHPVQVVEVHQLEVVVHGVAQVELDAQRHPAPPVPAQIGEAEAGRCQDDEEGQPRPQGRGVAQDHAVDDLALYQGDDGQADAAEDGTGEGQHHVGPMHEHVGPQAAYPTRPRLRHRHGRRGLDCQRT